MFSRKRSRIIAAAAAAIVLAGGSYGIVTATSSSASTTAASSSPAGGFGSGGGSNARSGPAAGGSSGTISSPSSSGFTLTTATGQKVTIKEVSSTTYEKGTNPASASATEAALAAYPGGIVDRVVAIGTGQYEVHYIGVNWPHHIFVSQDFQVIGADD